jgi:hypothetical protein
MYADLPVIMNFTVFGYNTSGALDSTGLHTKCVIFAHFYPKLEQVSLSLSHTHTHREMVMTVLI